MCDPQFAEDLIVKLPGLGARSDTDIAHAALNAMKWDTRIPEDKVIVQLPPLSRATPE